MKNIFVNLNMMVSDLIDLGNRCWKRDSLEELFYPREAEIILANKLVVDEEDFWVWDHEKSGTYTVKSGYWLANREKNVILIPEAEA